MTHIRNQCLYSCAFIHCFSIVSLTSNLFCNFQSVTALGFIPKLPELETREQSTEFIRPSHCTQCSRDLSENLNQILCDFTCLTAHLITPSTTILGVHEGETSAKMSRHAFQVSFCHYLSLFYNCGNLSTFLHHLHITYLMSLSFRGNFWDNIEPPADLELISEWLEWCELS